MEALAKMFFAFMSKDPQLRKGVFESIDFVHRLDGRLRAIEAKLGIEEAPLNGDTLPAIGQDAGR